MAGGTGSTDERSLGRKVLDGAKYVGKKIINQYSIMLIAFSSIAYIVCSGSLNELNPLKWGEANRKIKQINSSYNKLFENAANFEDSLRIYQELDLPIKLEELSFEDKERALEGRVE